MKNTLKIISFFVIVVCTSLLLSLLLKSFLIFPYQKILHRTVTILTAIGLPFLWKNILQREWYEIGLNPTTRRIHLVSYGFILGILSVTIIIIVGLIFNQVSLKETILWPKAISRILLYLLGGLIVGFFEESVFRGIIFQSLKKDMQLPIAITISCAFYSIVHFLKPTPEPWKVFTTFIGLFLVGLILTRAFIKTKTLYFSIGLHASWVLAIRTYKLFFSTHSKNYWIWGDNIFLSGIISWLFLIGIYIIVDKTKVTIGVRGKTKCPVLE